MPTTAQRRIQTGFRTRRTQRDRMIRAAGRNFDGATGDIFDRLMGIVAANRGGSDAVMQRVDQVLRAIPIDAAAAMEKTLQDIWQWSWISATSIIVQSIPIEVWFQRTAPLAMQIGDGTTEAVEPLPDGITHLPGDRVHWRRRCTECGDILEGTTSRFFVHLGLHCKRCDRQLQGFMWHDVPDLDVTEAVTIGNVGLPDEPEDLELLASAGWEKILSGEVTRDEAMEIIRQLEFPPPSVADVTAILNSTTAPDGLSAINRIKTVIRGDLGTLRETILRHVTAPPDVSSIDTLSKAIRPLIERNADGTAAGVNYKAQRIARTEGIRIAEAGQRAAIEQDRDLFDGIEWFSAHVPDTRADHAALEGLYVKTGSGWVRSDGQALEEIPFGPNCLCYTIPALSADLTAGLPPANLGTFDAAQKRFQAERANAG